MNSTELGTILYAYAKLRDAANEMIIVWDERFTADQPSTTGLVEGACGDAELHLSCPIGAIEDRSAEYSQQLRSALVAEGDERRAAEAAAWQATG